jgi:hypothetical protein
MHGLVGLAMGAFWRWELNWGLSIAGCTVVRSMGALGFVLLTSWLLRENILALITINAHASVSYMLAALGINVVPTMPMIYLVFASLVCMTFVSVPFLPPAKIKWNRMPIFGALFVFFLSSLNC